MALVAVARTLFVPALSLPVTVNVLQVSQLPVGPNGAPIATAVPLGFGGRRMVDLRVEGYAPRPDENTSAERTLVGSDYAGTKTFLKGVLEDSKRDAGYRAIQQALYDDLPELVLYQRELIWGVRKRVKGFQGRVGGDTRTYACDVS